MKHYLYRPSPAGLLELCEENGMLCSIVFCDAAEHEESAKALLEEAARQLREYFEGRRKSFDLPLKLPSSGFRRDVYNALVQVPFGQSVSYKELASLCGHPGASRAVGSAMASNDFVIVIPCHRVIKSGGGLGNYSGGNGSETKMALLEHERLYSG